MGNPTFFGKSSSSSSLAGSFRSIASNKGLVYDLTQKIIAFRDSFEGELRQSPKNREQIAASLDRSERCLRTLKKLEEGNPVPPEEQRQFLEYIKPIMYSSGAKLVEEQAEDKPKTTPGLKF
eukprot:TRINITY_DN98346_c0_g1_i1.p1 TRINITY_DN98346_c0_g1~~TRINITY_DN98346_c0_g1_i1.p1  ORF type:complete len:122 (+),score=7.08 TRINITY_DN98346_c0_g1_i1:193-558(+)